MGDHSFSLFIDPGVNTGIAIFKDGELELTEFFVEEKENRKLNYGSRVSLLADELGPIILFYAFDYAAIEGVEIWGQSLKSITSAAKGNLSFLSYIVGAYVSDLDRFCKKGIRPEIINPSTWKGQLPDDVVAKRVQRYMIQRNLSYTDVTHMNPHVNSAIGLGLYHFKVEGFYNASEGN